MAVFNGHTVTIQGAKLLSRSLAGEGKFVFTKGAFGEGKYEGDITTLEELIDKRLELPISDIAYYEGAAVLNLQISNKTVEESFYTNELGIYAKLEGDQNEVLFSYAVAIKPDAIPDNSLSVTFEGEYEIYIKLTTNENVGIKVNDDNVYITFKTGNREYVRTGCNILGLLSVQTELIEDGQYQATNGKWYLNIGGKRNWNRSGNPDNQLKEITFLQHEKDINKKQDETDNRLLTRAKKIWESINELFNTKLEKGGYTGTAQNLLAEISKIASKSILGRIIIGKGLSVDSSGRTSIISKNDGIIVNESDIQLDTIDNVTTNSGTKPLSARQGKILDEEKLAKGNVSIEYNTAKKIEDKIIEAKQNGDDAKDEANTKISKNTIGTVNSLETLNNAIETGIYLVSNYNVNNLYGFGFLYVSKSGNVISQYYVSHHGGTCYRQDWNGNIANGEWVKQWDDQNFNPETKYNKTGGTVSGNVTVTGNEVVNGAVSCNSIILNGYTITIE